MAKDAKGHGSEKRGGSGARDQAPAHSAGVQAVGRSAPQVSDAAMGVIRGAAPGTGFSVTPGGAQPTDGYMVSLPSRTQSVDQAALSGPGGRDIINQYTATHADVFGGNPAVHIGGWNDPGTKKMSLDPSEQFKDRGKAIAAGVARNQKAIWDVKNKTEIPTGGSGT